MKKQAKKMSARSNEEFVMVKDMPAWKSCKTTESKIRWCTDMERALRREEYCRNLIRRIEKNGIVTDFDHGKLCHRAYLKGMQKNKASGLPVELQDVDFSGHKYWIFDYGYCKNYEGFDDWEFLWYLLEQEAEQEAEQEGFAIEVKHG